MSQEVHKHLAHITWTQEVETLDCGIDRQQRPKDDVFMDNIVTLELLLQRLYQRTPTTFRSVYRVEV